eukprot:351879-Chlamydomonas_euryale.AAC.3
MDDLLAALQTTQKAKTTSRLSERNVVELVNKLKQVGSVAPACGRSSASARHHRGECPPLPKREDDKASA